MKENSKRDAIGFSNGKSMRIIIKLRLFIFNYGLLNLISLK